MRKKVIDLKSILKISKKYKYYKDFRKNEPIAYNDLIKINKLDIIKNKLVQSYLSEKDVLLRAKKCKTRMEFRNQYPSEYTWLARRKKLNLINFQKKKRIKRTKKEALLEVSNFKTTKDLLKNRGLYAFLKRNNLTKHPKVKNLPKVGNFKQSLNKIKKEIRLNRYKYLDEIYSKKSKWYNFIRHNKVKILLLNLLIDRGHPLSWDKPMVKKELKKYKSLHLLKKNKYSLYEKALFYGLIKGKNKKGREVHSFENIKKKALKCKSKQEFIAKYRSEYNAVIKQKINLNLPDLNKNSSYGEAVLRSFLEKVFKTKFTKSRPLFMKNPNSNRKLELDGYSPILKLAFEHQGQQHFNKTSYLNRSRKNRQSFEVIQRNDRTKVRLCKKEGVLLIQIPDLFNILRCDEKKTKELIASKLRKAGRPAPQSLWITKINYAVNLKSPYLKKKEK